jgi:hypothetical protein
LSELDAILFELRRKMHANAVSYDDGQLLFQAKKRIKKLMVHVVRPEPEEIVLNRIKRL